MKRWNGNFSDWKWCYFSPQIISPSNSFFFLPACCTRASLSHAILTLANFFFHRAWDMSRVERLLRVNNAQQREKSYARHHHLRSELPPEKNHIELNSAEKSRECTSKFLARREISIEIQISLIFWHSFTARPFLLAGSRFANKLSNVKRESVHCREKLRRRLFQWAQHH